MNGSGISSEAIEQAPPTRRRTAGCPPRDKVASEGAVLRNLRANGGIVVSMNTGRLPGQSCAALLASFLSWQCLPGMAGTTVVAWGDNTYCQTNVPPGLTNVVAL